MYNPLVIFIGLIVLIILISKISVSNIIDKDLKIENIIKNQNFESPSFDSCGDLSNCKKDDNLEVVTVQSMLPYVDDSVLDSKPSWQPVLCKPIVN